MKAILAGICFLASGSLFSQVKERFSVYFDFDSHSLDKKAIASLDSFWKSQPGPVPAVEYEINGYCDNMGTDLYNQALSEKRVGGLKEYLLSRGVNIKSIRSARGFGENSPVNENRTAEERRLNRRVDIIIIKEAEAIIPEKEKEGNVSLERKIADSNTRAGTTIILKNINFVGGMHQLLPESQAALDELLNVMKSYPTLQIRVEGHICCQAGDSDGTDLETGIANLSEARARAVRDYLVENGISGTRVSYKGFGHSAPLYSFPEKTEEEMKLNRRVEIKILGK